MVDLTIYKEYEMVITELKNRAGSNSVLDEIIVKAMGYDKRGRLNLSRKEVFNENKPKWWWLSFHWTK